MANNVTMDFSDMFKPAGGRKRNVKDESDVSIVPVVDQENSQPNSESVDSVAYVKRHLASLNYDVSSIELNKYLAKIMETMLSEKSHWQNQASVHADECAKLRNQIKLVSIERERETAATEALRKDQVFLNSRISSLTAEHRETRNQWLSEKSDYESRLFQIQGLNTTMQGTMKKKEKDFEKLQNQYAKLVKDNERGNKAVIQISQPLKKGITQSTSDLAKATSMSLLKDAEVMAARNAATHLENENKSLRTALESFQTTMNDLRVKFEQSLLMSEAQNQAQVDQLVRRHEEQLRAKEALIEQMQFEHERNGSKLNAMVEQYRTISLAKVIEPTSLTASTSTVDANASAAVAAEPTTPSKSTNVTSDGVSTPPVVKQYLSGTPSAVAKYITATPGTLAKKYLEGTPGARPVSWVVEQANTEVKRLRERVEDIKHLKSGSGSVKFLTESDLDGENPEHCLIKQKLMSLRAQLSEAMCVIQEQDRLIHEALVGKPYTLDTDPQRLWSIDEDNEDESAATITSGTVGEAGPAAATTSSSTTEEDDVITLKDSDFLPPASPATIQLLEGYGWSSIPRIPQSVQQQQQQQQKGGSVEGLPSYEAAKTGSGTQLQF